MMGNLYEICYNHALEAMEVIDIKTFMQLVYGHSKLIGYLRRLLLFGEQAIKKLNRIERHQRVKKIDQMSNEFLQRVFLFVSQNADRLDWQSIERFIASLAATGQRFGKYEEMLIDLAAIYAGIIKSSEMPENEKLIRFTHLIGLFKRISLAKSTQALDY